MSDPRPPKSPRKGKYVNIRIAFLNDTVHVFQVPVKGVGSLLWDAVVNHLQLLEADYFDLEYTNQHGDDCWLDKDKTVLKQIGSPDVPLRFCVKFYTPDPGLLEDELTRYLFALQVRKDLLRGELRCSENTAALLASYVVQGEIGDFDIDEYPDPTYLAVFKFVPEHLQTHEFMAKVMDYHKQHIGESPSEADLNLLDTARKVELYGIKMQSAKDHEGVSLNLAVAHLGVLVFQQYTKINTFSWAKVRKLSFKRKKFLIKLHADTYDRRLDGVAHTPTKSGRGYYKDTVEFFFDTRDRCKLFWKRCIEHHAFFRCQVVAKVPRNKTRVVSRGSSFRYCGRTQKQLVEYVRENIGKRPHFERSTSGRISSRSTSVTPKISSKPGIHSSSADLHTSSGSRSSGSHILDNNHTPGSGVMRDHSGTPHSAMRVESVDVHSDSSMSGSRSLNSPRLEHGLSIDQDVIEAVNARTEGAMTDEDEEEDLKDSSSLSQGREGMSHVSSETKGAHSLLSPDLNSPVRYVGLYSEVGSPDYHGDRMTSPEVDPLYHDRERVVSPAGHTKQEVAGVPAASSGELSHACTSERDSGDFNLCNNSDTSVCTGGSLPASVQNIQLPRPNLDLKLTNITSSSSSSFITASSSEISSADPHHHGCPPQPLHIPPSNTSTPHSSSHTSSISFSPSAPFITPNVSASQNVNDPVNDKPSRAPKSSRFQDEFSGQTPPSSVHSSVSLERCDRDEGHKKVSLFAMGQQQSEGKESDLSPPFPSPPPPLSPQYMEEDIKKSLDTSPSSCVTDTAQSRQESKVRLLCRVSSLDCNRVSPVTTCKDKPTVSPSQPCPELIADLFVGEKKESSKKVVLDKKVELDEKVELDSGGLNSETTQKHIGKLETLIDEKIEKPIDELEKQEGTIVMSIKNKANTDEVRQKKEGSSTPKESVPKKFPNGKLVGAGAPVKEHHLETAQGSSRKLSAGTDLIEDIPYILHRRLDGHKEETAVYRVSEADKLKRQRSSSPAAKSAPLTSGAQTEILAGEQGGSERPKTPDRKCLSPDIGNDGSSFRSKTPTEKTAPHRYEFVHVHKLPSRTSYSSVDDTTSPSAEQELLQHMEHATVDTAKMAEVHKASPEKKSKKPSQEASLKQKVESKSDAGQTGDDEKTKEIQAVYGSDVAAEADSVIEPNEKKPVVFEDTPLFQPDNSLVQSPKSLRDDVSQGCDDIQFYSPKIPGSKRLKQAINTSDESPDAVLPRAGAQFSTSETATKNPTDLTRHLQFFEVSKPQPCHGRESSSETSVMSIKDMPNSLPLMSSQAEDHNTSIFGKPQSPSFMSEKTAQSPPDTLVSSSTNWEKKSEGKVLKHRAPSLSATGRNSTSSTSSSDNNQFLIDLPSPAAALFYSDNDSPPPTQSRVNGGTSPLTFSTFRPDPAEDVQKVEDVPKEKLKSNRWSLQSVEESDEATDYKVIMSEGVVEKSALKKRTFDDADKPKEPKRVSWHEDGDLQHSYHSDMSMTAQRSPVDDCDTTLFGEGLSHVDSGDILETLENLRQQNSESDMTNSGSSASTSDGSDEETHSNAKQVYMQYAASKGLSHSSKEGTVDSDISGISEAAKAQRREISPLESLEHLGSLEGSFGSRKFSADDDSYKPSKDGSPLEPLEKLSSLCVDNFDDEGEADDEDDEPNFPPPPPILDIPDEMLVSYESDLPLPDIAYSSCNPLTPNPEGGGMAAAAAGESETGNIGDLVGDMSYTTSESESDFDAEVATQQLRRSSASNIAKEVSGRIPGEAKKPLAFSECKRRVQASKAYLSGSKRSQDLPEVLLKPVLQQQPLGAGAQAGQPSTHFVQKSQPLPHKSGPPPPVLPKPKPPPTQPRSGPIRQPQMGKLKHYDRTRHMSSSSSSSSSSEIRQHPPSPAPS